MTESDFRELLARIQAGKMSPAEAWQSVETALSPTSITAEALVDLDRSRRCGYPEVVFGTGKTPDAIVAVFAAQRRAGQNSLATRVTPDQAEIVLQEFPGAKHNAVARTVSLQSPASAKPGSSGKVIVVTAGTSDLPVAAEAEETAKWMGCETDFILDVGVAGPHRLLQQRERLQSGDAIVVVAGMEGALPSVVAGWVAVPVIAVPTSVGYGASFGGVAALLSMLNSCAANVCVVNIDAGFKGGFLAGLVAGRTRAT
jgi:NCAIR mutase (PurE)-related protein